MTEDKIIFRPFSFFCLFRVFKIRLWVALRLYIYSYFLALSPLSQYLPGEKLVNKEGVPSLHTVLNDVLQKVQQLFVADPFRWQFQVHQFLEFLWGSPIHDEIGSLSGLEHGIFQNQFSSFLQELRVSLSVWKTRKPGQACVWLFNGISRRRWNRRNLDVVVSCNIFVRSRDIVFSVSILQRLRKSDDICRSWHFIISRSKIEVLVKHC